MRRKSAPKYDSISNIEQTNKTKQTKQMKYDSFLNSYRTGYVLWIDGAGRCSTSPNEELFAGFRGAFHCLVEGGGDVAFVRHTTPFENTDGSNIVDAWAAGLSSNNFRLLCKEGGVRPVQEFQTCNLGKIPAPKVDQLKTNPANGL